MALVSPPLLPCKNGSSWSCKVAQDGAAQRLHVDGDLQHRPAAFSDRAFILRLAADVRKLPDRKPREREAEDDQNLNPP